MLAVLTGMLLLAVAVLTATLLHLLAEFAIARGLPASPLWRHAIRLLRAAYVASRESSPEMTARTAAGAAVICSGLLVGVFVAFVFVVVWGLG
ncbi:hypothetical protein [Arenimonas alkanexedens]